MKVTWYFPDTGMRKYLLLCFNRFSANQRDAFEDQSTRAGKKEVRTRGL